MAMDDLVFTPSVQAKPREPCHVSGVQRVSCIRIKSCAIWGEPDGKMLRLLSNKNFALKLSALFLAQMPCLHDSVIPLHSFGKSDVAEVLCILEV